MRIIKEQESMDGAAEPSDVIQVELQDSIIPGSKTLYVHVNGRTVLRIGHITTKVDFNVPDLEDEAYKRGLRQATNHEDG